MPLPPGRARSVPSGSWRMLPWLSSGQIRVMSSGTRTPALYRSRTSLYGMKICGSAAAPTSSARIRRWSAMMSFITATFSGIVVAFRVSSAVSCSPRMPMVQLLSYGAFSRAWLSSSRR